MCYLSFCLPPIFIPIPPSCETFPSPAFFFDHYCFFKAAEPLFSLFFPRKAYFPFFPFSFPLVFVFLSWRLQLRWNFVRFLYSRASDLFSRCVFSPFFHYCMFPFVSKLFLHWFPIPQKPCLLYWLLVILPPLLLSSFFSVLLSRLFVNDSTPCTPRCISYHSNSLVLIQRRSCFSFLQQIIILLDHLCVPFFYS